jgi:hypothetical protein
MPFGNDSEVLHQQQVRLFFQFGGPRPGNPLQYYGLSAQYAFLQGSSDSFGSVDAIYMPSPRRTGGYALSTRTRSAPDLPEATLQMMQKIGTVPRALGEQGCALNIYLVTGSCGNDLSNPLNGWTEYVEVYSACIPESVDYGDRMDRENDDPLMDSYTLKPAAIYKAGALSFGEQAASAIDREVVDVVYGWGTNCGNCGPTNDGTRRLYAVTKSSGAGSPGLPANVVYVNRNPITGAISILEYDITGLSATADPTFIDVMGPYLIVGVASTNSYYYALLDSVTGAPGTWTQVTTGFVASKTPQDIWVKSPSEAYISGNGGYIYKLTDITAGVSVLSAGAATTQNLTRIHGNGTTIVAVGATGVVLRSITNGDTWALTSANAGAASLTGIVVFSQSFLQAVNASGVHYTSEDGGASWTARAIPGATACSDIVYATDEVGYILYTNGTSAGLQATTYGGAQWYDSRAANSRIASFPTFYQANRLAVPFAAGATLLSGTLAIGGLATSVANADGILITGASTFQ